MTDFEAFGRAVCAGDAAATRRALETSAYVREHINDPVFPFGQRALHMVAKDTALLDLLLTFGADLHLRSEWDKGPYSVLDNANDASARFLIERGAKLTACVASRLGWFDELRAIVESDPAGVHERGGDGQQALHQAANVEIAAYLLAHGAAIDARCIDHHSTPAQYALGDRDAICRFLLERGAAPDIFMAAKLGDRVLAERLIEADASCLSARVNQPGYAPVPPFNIYCWTLGFLVSPHQVARRHGHEELYDLLIRRSPPRVRLLEAVASGNEADARSAMSHDGAAIASLTPDEHGLLAHAIFHCQFDAADLMLRLGFDPIAPGVDGGSALHAACWMGHDRLVERLLATGRVPVEARDPTHQSTPLGWAAFGSVHRRARGGNYPRVVELLVDAGADVKAPANGDKESLLRMAEGNADVQAALRRLGAS